MRFFPRPRWQATLSLALVLCNSVAQSGSPTEPAHAPLPLHAPVQDKNFYVLSLIEQNADANRAVRSDATLALMAKAKRDALAKVTGSCAADIACYVNALKFSDSEIAAAARILERLGTEDPAVRALAEGPMVTSGAFIAYRTDGTGQRLARAWTDAAHGIDGILDVYGLGRAPRYPAIDAVSFDVKSQPYGKLVSIVAAVLAEDSANLQLFFQPSLRFALGLLDANHRDEAGRFEPLEAGENRAALRRLATIQWDRFPYTAIVAPGSGNESESVMLSAWGKLRLTLAVRRFRDGKAPFLLVSGGFVHPNQTAHCEAIEMKRSLMADFGLPEDAILIDPHARHTTTNVRNAVREFYRYGFPFSKRALIVTDQEQSAYIEGATFTDRCAKELGYQPALSLTRLSQFDLTFVPNIQSLQFDARDPLDP